MHKFKIQFTVLLALVFSTSAALASNSYTLNLEDLYSAGSGGEQGQDDEEDKGEQQGGDQDEEQDKDQDKDQNGEVKVDSEALRVDCRYHNEENIAGIGHCYASAVYVPGENTFTDVRLGVGCDYKTIYNNAGRVHTEQVSERLSPQTAALPGVEVFPQGSLRQVGTYESVLDIRAGRLAGICYVHDPDEFSPMIELFNF